jgi:hypothetical protein
MTQQINLYQAKFRKQRKALSAREASLGLLLIAGSVAAWAGLVWQQSDRLAREAERVAHNVAEQKAVADRLVIEVNQRKKDAQLESAVQRAEQRVAATRDVMQIINGDSVGSTNGYSEQLRGLARQSLQGLWLTGFTLAANADENVIRGRTLDPELVPTYLRRLNAERTLQGRHFDSLVISVPSEATASANALPASAPGTSLAAAVAAVSGAGAGTSGASGGSGVSPSKLTPPPKFLEFSVSAAKLAPAQANGGSQ